ncbi:MAG: YdeI/OmpD-associated family protein [Ilumatobacteraceae bacterium]
MPDRRDDAARVHAEDANACGDGLERHHATEPGAWLVTWKKKSGRPAPTYEEGVIEALRFGWVDSTGRALDDEATMLWYAPRKRGSGWARPNKQRIAKLEQDGRMAPAGVAVVEAAKADGSWSLLDAVEDLVVPDDLAKAFKRHRGSAEQWEAFPRSAKRGILEWIVQAKRAPTRAKRIEETARLAADGKRANQWPRS